MEAPYKMTIMEKIEPKSSLPEIREINDEEFEKASFYETLFNNLMAWNKTETKELKKGDICLHFDVWREPYRVGGSEVYETFMELILGKVENSEPLTLSEAICLNTYQDSIRYTTASFTWSRGSISSPSEVILFDNELFQRLKKILNLKTWTKDVSYKKEHVATLVKNLENYYTQRPQLKKATRDFKRAEFYEPLLAILMNQDRLEKEYPETGGIYLYFDVWREPYRVGGSEVYETFMELILGQVKTPHPLTFSETISLDTYQDKLTYSTGRITWSRGSMVSPFELVPVSHELFQRIKIMLKTAKWENSVSYDRRHLTTFVRNLENYFTGKYSGKNYRVVNREVLAKGLNAIISLELEAPEIAAEAAPGQFVVIRLHERGERIPLTIADMKRDEGIIRIIFQVVGKTTEELATLEKGDFVLDLLGPLGNPINTEKYDKPVICIAGGVGVASIYAKAKALKEKGNYVISIIGAKTKHILILEEEMRRISDEFYVITDDGSYSSNGERVACLYRIRKDGSKVYGGFVTSVLEALFGQYKLLAKENERIEDVNKKFLDYGPPQMIGKHSPRNVAKVIAVGPIPMMQAVVNVVAGNGNYDPERDYRDDLLLTLVSLNPIMVDGTGLCGSCRVRIYNREKKRYETKFACVDGPIFNGLLVDFEALLRRTRQYKLKEQKSAKYLEIVGW